MMSLPVAVSPFCASHHLWDGRRGGRTRSVSPLLPPPSPVQSVFLLPLSRALVAFPPTPHPNFTPLVARCSAPCPQSLPRLRSACPFWWNHSIPPSLPHTLILSFLSLHTPQPPSPGSTG
eukprot:Sspe_Gene.49713::Locus_27024_Transcript_1_1_Confidence_1.000_Length_489::g.49713::m.49713